MLMDQCTLIDHGMLNDPETRDGNGVLKARDTLKSHGVLIDRERKERSERPLERRAVVL
jgi:hypothetical protein